MLILLKRPEMNYEHIEQLAKSEVELDQDIRNKLKFTLSMKDILKNHYSKWSVLKRWKIKKFLKTSIMMRFQA